MPAAMNEEGIEVKPNNVLSDIDKAYMIINYPHPVDTPLLDPVCSTKSSMPTSRLPGRGKL